MRLDHLAIWVNNLEKMKEFYMKYFNMDSNEMYENSKKQFTSYFLSYENGLRIELMHKPTVFEALQEKGITNGLAHFAISTGDKNKMMELTETFRNDGYIIQSEPRLTGDGYYESVVLDPENNLIEITN